MQVELCKILDDDILPEYENETVATEVMECLRKKVSPHLMDMINMVLIGFADMTQYEMAHNLLDFVSWRMVRTTGCPSADAALESCYRWIAADDINRFY